MKKLSIALLAISILLTASLAQAYAVYNHVDHKVCVQTKWDIAIGACKFWVPADGKHSGPHGSGLNGIRMAWWYSSDKCRGTGYFDIPDGGYARIYNDEVKIYKHDDKQADGKSVSDCDCPDLGPAKKK